MHSFATGKFIDLNSKSSVINFACPFSGCYRLCNFRTFFDIKREKKSRCAQVTRWLALFFFNGVSRCLTFGNVEGAQLAIKTIVHLALFPTWYIVLKSSSPQSVIRFIRGVIRPARLLSTDICQVMHTVILQLVLTRLCKEQENKVMPFNSKINISSLTFTVCSWFLVCLSFCFSDKRGAFLQILFY